MRIGSLFSGAGGLDLAVEAVFGAKTAWHCEIDKAASTVLSARWPDVPNLSDITAVDWSSVDPVDILCGGWPCQPFSLAGKRKGADDERALWPYVARAVRMVRPRIVVLENVSAVLGPEFQRVANDLASLGYDITWTCLRASEVGAPHRRERVFILATDTAGERWAGRNEPRPHMVGDGPIPTHVRSPGLAPNSSRDGWDEGWPESAGLVGGSDAAVSGDGPVNLLPTPEAKNCHAGPDYARMQRDGSGGHDLVTALALLATPSVADGEGGHLNRSGDRKGEMLLPGQAREMATNWGKYGTAISRWESLTRPAPAPTEPNTKGNPRLSASFSEWMMGWPAGWVTDVHGISRNEALRIIGNGVVPQQGHAALQWLLQVAEAVA